MKKVYLNDIEVVKSYMFFYFLLSFLSFMLIVICVYIKNFLLLFFGIITECIIIYKIVINILKVKNYDENSLYNHNSDKNKKIEFNQNDIQKEENKYIFNDCLNAYLEKKKNINFEFCPYCGCKLDTNKDSCKKCGNRIPR